MVRIADLSNGNYWRHMGMSTVEKEGKIQVIMEIKDNLKQFYGNVHGGALAGLIDGSIAVAVNQALDPGVGASTVEMKINYLRPANTGTLRAEGKVIQKGRNIIVGQSEIKDDEGNLVAFGTATFMVTQLKR
ncbi:PaaI family thioesterase [Desulfosporosinus sp. PR]|uniref:PaaI family thioesterase n=1 Tax=Candidatus Desulfosporosinus nitrosoreducens TaxID=3401928 RepID=UPI0027FDF762|nr:PaaI family thioesterase [Desulfosporosinus sp. PR]MDQ7096814.1 PaaI family thioesterase [Desulfosporosinus sp. PR]